MKKAKVLVPALSVLCLSAIAAVSSTVAWFTAVNSASFETSSFKVQPLEGQMTMSITAGVGTKVTGTTVSPKENCNLTHGSFDPANKNVWTLDTILGDVYKQVGVGKDLTDANDASFLCEGQAGLYHVMSWDVTFSYSFGTNAAAKSLNLYFDGSATGSTATHTETLSDGTDAARGFRMAFIGTSWMVWSPFQGTVMSLNTPAESDKASAYVAGTNTTTPYTVSTTDPTVGNLHYEGETIDRVATSEGGTNRKDYLGTITPATSPDAQGKYVGTLTVKVVTWFEGLDPNVVNDTNIDCAVSSTSAFYLRTAA